jgi:D,D-heptose 1,7-bisphosphate phosphatase
MAEIGGKPLLEHQIILARRHGIEEVVFLLGYGAQKIIDYFGDGSHWGVRIRHVVEAQPRGAAGAVLEAWPVLEGRFFVMYGDTMLNVDLGRFSRAHALSNAAVSLFLHPNDHPFDSDLVEMDETGCITAFHPYPHDAGRYYPNLVNAALYVVNKSALEYRCHATAPLDFGRDLFPEMLARGDSLHGYRSPEYIKDAGTPERLDHVADDYRSGRIERGSLETPAPAIFLDRDGTLNEGIDRVTRADDLSMIEGAGSAIRRINNAGHRAVVITNQPVIARGDCDERQLAEIHNKLEWMLGLERAFIDAIYYCPHHPDSGFEGELRELKFVCGCRKPATGLIERARDELNIDLARSWFIGDSTVDVRTARNAGLRSILVKTGHAGRDGRYSDEPDHYARDLNEAVDLTLGQVASD